MKKASKKICKLLKSLTKQGDFLYYEGSLFSHFKNTIDKDDDWHYFYRWYDCDDESNRWLVFRVKTEDLLLYLNKKISEYEFIKISDEFLLVDIVVLGDFPNYEIQHKNIFYIKKHEISDEHLPLENVFFDENRYEKYSVNLRNELNPQ